jgi:hypothetical protein
MRLVLTDLLVCVCVCMYVCVCMCACTCAEIFKQMVLYCHGLVKMWSGAIHSQNLLSQYSCYYIHINVG